MGLTSHTHADLAKEAWLLKAELILHEIPFGSRVRIRGGFENGATGHVVGVRERAGHGGYPVFSVLFDGADLPVGGFPVDQLDVLDPDPDFTEFGEQDGLYILECYSCGARGTNHVFGLGNDRRCFDAACLSWGVHSA